MNAFMRGYRIDIHTYGGKVGSQYVWHDESAFNAYARMCRIAQWYSPCVELYDITTEAAAAEPISTYGTEINRNQRLTVESGVLE